MQTYDGPVGLRDTRAGLLVQAAGSRLPERGVGLWHSGGVRRNGGEEPGAVDGRAGEEPSAVDGPCGRPCVGAAWAAWRRDRAVGRRPAV